jgi:hypothetical protein
MSQKHPRRRAVDGHVLDPTDFNEALRPFEETTLDEQNLSTRCKSQLARGGDFEEGTFGRSGRAGDAGIDVSGATDPIDALAQTYSNVSTTAYGDVRFPIYDTDSWVPIETTRASFLADGGGWLDLEGKLQLNEEIGVLAAAEGSAETSWPMAHCMQLGIFLDGGLIYEGVVGGQDRTTEAANMDQGRHLYLHGMCRGVRVRVAAGHHEVVVAVRVVTLHGKKLWDWSLAASGLSPLNQPLALVTSAYLRYRLETK